MSAFRHMFAIYTFIQLQIHTCIYFYIFFILVSLVSWYSPASTHFSPPPPPYNTVVPEPVVLHHSTGVEFSHSQYGGICESAHSCGRGRGQYNLICQFWGVSQAGKI